MKRSLLNRMRDVEKWRRVLQDDEESEYWAPAPYKDRKNEFPGCE